MTRKSCLVVLVATAALPLFAACSDVSSSTEPQMRIRRDGGDSTGFDARCGDTMPWGIAPCVVVR